MREFGKETYTLEEVNEAMDAILDDSLSHEEDSLLRKIGNTGMDFIGKLRFRDSNSGDDMAVDIDFDENGERLATVTRIRGEESELTQGRLISRAIRESSEFVVEHKKEGVVATLGIVATIGTLYAARKRRK